MMTNIPIPHNPELGTFIRRLLLDSGVKCFSRAPIEGAHRTICIPSEQDVPKTTFILELLYDGKMNKPRNEILIRLHDYHYHDS